MRLRFKSRRWTRGHGAALATGALIVAASSALISCSSDSSNGPDACDFGGFGIQVVAAAAHVDVPAGPLQAGTYACKQALAKIRTFCELHPSNPSTKGYCN